MRKMKKKRNKNIQQEGILSLFSHPTHSIVYINDEITERKRDGGGARL